MRRISMAIALAGIASAAVGAALPPQSISGVGGGLTPEGDPIQRCGKRGKGLNNKRGKGPRSKPKRRPNRLLISKRVRRKHRRRAA